LPPVSRLASNCYGMKPSVGSQVTEAGGVAFVTTQWSMVLTAQGHSPAADQALEILCRRYWRPLFGFVRRSGFSHEEAEDLTQAFFARLLERRDLDVVRQEKGRLRSYLLVSLKHFLANERQRASAVKRGEGKRVLSLDEMREDERGNFEPADPVTVEQIYQRTWANTVLEQVLSRLQEEYMVAGNAELFERLKVLLVDDRDRPSQAEMAAELHTTENALKQAFHRFRQRYRQVLREEIAHTVATPGDVEDELRHLIAVLRA
jgi:DNA-directed RNA polymerase specialized sigma24 family protein